MRRDVVTVVLVSLSLACGTSEEPRDPSVAITPVVLPPAGFEAEDRTRMDATARPVLLHFWATWCAPCRRELPSLLAAARDAGVDDRVIAVSLDQDWAAIATFFGADVPRGVVREPTGTTARTLGVSTLPDTYLVDGTGRVTRRIARPLDWERPEHRAWLAASLSDPDRKPEERRAR